MPFIQARPRRLQAVHLARVLFILGYASSGLGCGVKRNDANKSPVVAIVNHQEITASQLNQLLQSTDADPGAPEVTKQAIDSLVSEELLVEGAVQHGLDRDPGVVQSIDMARRDVLARSFAERNLYPKQPVTRGEIEEFYRSHPILFEKRKRFQLKSFSINSADLSEPLKVELDGVHASDDVRDLLDKHGITYAARSNAIDADELPIDKLSDFARASTGDLLIAQQRNGKTSLMFIAAIEDDNPLSLEHAAPYIELYLANVRNGKSITDYLSQAKATSRIQYPMTPGNPQLQPTIPASIQDASYSVGRPPGRDLAGLDSLQKHAAP